MTLKEFVPRSVGLFVLVALVSLWSVSCSERQAGAPAGEQRDTQGSPALDTSDPKSVAAEFFRALARKDVDAALQQVLPEERSALRKHLEDMSPPIPEKFQLQVESMTENQEAEIQMVDQEFGADLLYQDGRWWVSK